MRWCPEQYTRFERERTRPVRDLVAAIPRDTAVLAVDVGCGPGNSTEVLAARFPDARVVAFDSSPDMCAEARRRLAAMNRISVEPWHVEDWASRLDPPTAAADVILANAVLQWVPDHATLLPRLVSRLAPGGVLAVQLPDNLEEPAHLAMEAVAAEAPWRARLGTLRAAGTPSDPAGRRTAIAAPDWFVRLLRPQCSNVEVWRTTYVHELRDGVDGVVEWMKGTGLRPYLDPLEPREQAAFLDAYRRRLEPAFTPLDDGSVLLPFPRLFIIATRGER